MIDSHRISISVVPALTLRHAHIAPPPQGGRAIAFGKDVPFFLSPRGEEGTQRVSDGKVRGSFRRRICFRKQREICAPPSPSHAFGAGPSLSPMGRGDIGASVKCNRPALQGGRGLARCTEQRSTFPLPLDEGGSGWGCLGARALPCYTRRGQD